ncbi:MAG: 30S ribosomal protein S4, partial [Gemmatimonadetes bacterium]|nr:30S ribosomal protein S4 [Gemmatimonadota bacterium]
MARYTGPVCKRCRREGQKLFLKGTKCYTEKCPVERRQYPPGQHGPASVRRRKQSDYAVQLREKQKVKRIYGLQEKQFRNLFTYAATRPGVTGDNLIIALESRLDNVVFRMGFASNRRQARQLIRHRHVAVNGQTVNIPSFRVSAGDEVALRPKSRNLEAVELSLGARTRP